MTWWTPRSTILQSFIALRQPMPEISVTKNPVDAHTYTPTQTVNNISLRISHVGIKNSNRYILSMPYQHVGIINKAFVDIRLRPSIRTLAVAVRPIVVKSDVIHKMEVHNVSQQCQRRTEPRPLGTCTKNFVKIGPVVPEICSQTDRHTDRQTN